MSEAVIAEGQTAAADDAPLAPQPPQLPPRPQLTPIELAERGEAPVKAAYIRNVTSRVHVGAVAGSLSSASCETGVVPAGAGERQRDVRTKSKNQAKRDRKQERYSTAELCTSFALGRCRFGETCRFNHDVAAYLSTKVPELPGSCPFNTAPACPYGITCRWASTHVRPDALVQQYILDAAAAKQEQPKQAEDQQQAEQPSDGLQQQQPETQQGGTAQQAAADAEGSLRHGGGSHTQAAEPAAAASASLPAPQEPGTAAEQGWWRQDGTLPAAVLELPVGAEAPREPLNTLDKEVQQQLRRGNVPFEAADAVLAAMGIVPHRAGRGGGRGGRGDRGGRGGGRGGRGQQKQHGAAAGAAAAPDGSEASKAAAAGPATAAKEEEALAAGDPPAAKRLKLEERPADGGGDSAAAPMAVDLGAQPAANDAAFVEGLGVPAAAADATTSGTASGAAPATEAPTGGDKVQAAAPAAAGGGDYSEAALHPREKRSLDLRGKTFLAPLTTVGNLPFRRLCKTLGADVTCGEMALATNLLQGQPSEWALLKRHASEDCFGVQLCGGYPDSMARCAQLVEEQCQVDFVDCNFGCPIDIVCGKGAGSACLLKPQRLQQIVRSMSAVLSCPLTFKMRKGYSDGQDMAHTLVPHAASWGAAAVNLHGRTREQRYSKQADWPYIKRCVEAAQGTPLQVVGNGDVFSFGDHYRHLEECPGLATTYIARGALIKPWIFTEIKERRHWDISAGERLDFFKSFCAFGLEHWGSDSRGVESTRRFLLEWLSFTHRYIPVGLLEVLPQRMHWRSPAFVGRSDLETLLASDNAADWVAISEMLLGPAPAGFVFSPKHKANSHARREPAGAAAAMPATRAPAPGGGDEEY